jgi:DNA polymerase III epsilon subunit family exonuclease
MSFLGGLKEPRNADKKVGWIKPRPHSGEAKVRKAMFSCFDFETTGLSARRDRVIEVGVVRVSGGRIRDRWTTLVNPGEGVDVGPTKIHGIKKDWLVNAPTFEEIAPDLLTLLQGTVLVAHNAKFDISFLEEELDRTDLEVDDLDMLYWDTMEIANIVGSKTKKLTDVAKAVGVKVRKSHQALDDAEVLGNVVAKVIPKAPKKQKVPLFKAPSGLLPSGRALHRPRVG